MISPNYPDYFYTSDGIRIFFTTNFKPEELGDGEPVLIFNYGLVCNISHYKFQIPYFHKLGFKILFHDYRFHYSSGSTDNFKECSFDKIVDDMTQLTTSLGIKKSFHVGHSMGVNITLEFASRNPEMIIGMVLISGTVLPPQDVMFDTNLTEIASPLIHNLVENYPDSFKALWKNQFMNPIARYIIHQGGFNTQKVSDEFIQIYVKKIGELAPEVFLQLFHEMKTHNILSRLETILTPALIMGGSQDQVIPNYLQKILHQHLPKSQLYIIKDGSHVPQVDFHKNVNARIEMFLDYLLNG